MKRYALLLVFILHICFVLIQPIFSQSWSQKAPMITARHHTGSAVIGNLVYIIGGGTPAQIENKNEVYNTLTNSWATLAPMPTARGEAGVAVVNGKIYVIGGYNLPDYALSVVEEYNPATDSWTTKAPMPTARSGFSVSVVNNRIYAIGGWDETTVASSKVEEFDPSTNTWTTKAPLPFGRLQHNCSEGYSNGKLYIIGGKDTWHTAFYNNNSSYDATNNNWTEKSPSPIQFYHGATCLDNINGKLHLTGGSIGSYGTYIASFNSYYIYDIANDQWITSVNLPAKRAHHTSAFVNGKIYVIGGKDENGNTVNTVYEFSNSVLPLKWGNFTGIQKEANVVLMWETLQEQNTLDFTIEHSKEGSIWIPVGKVNSAMNSSELKKYSFTHQNPQQGKNFYRVLQTDINGGSAFSKTISVQYNDNLVESFLISGSATNGCFWLTMFKSGYVSLYNNSGALLWTKFYSAGQHQINIAGYARGIYYIKVNNRIKAIVAN